MVAFSFNTQGPAGIALQGEVSHRPNQPIQNATPELLLAALGAPNVFTGQTQIPGAPVGVMASALVPDGTFQQGWSRVKMTQAQITGTKAIPNTLGADQVVFVGEAGFTRSTGSTRTCVTTAPLFICRGRIWPPHWQARLPLPSKPTGS